MNEASFRLPIEDCRVSTQEILDSMQEAVIESINHSKRNGQQRTVANAWRASEIIQEILREAGIDLRDFHTRELIARLLWVNKQYTAAPMPLPTDALHGALMRIVLRAEGRMKPE